MAGVDKSLIRDGQCPAGNADVTTTSYATACISLVTDQWMNTLKKELTQRMKTRSAMMVLPEDTATMKEKHTSMRRTIQQLVTGSSA